MLVCTELLPCFVSLTCAAVPVLSETVDIKYIGGADPEMVLLDAGDNEVQVIYYIIIALYGVQEHQCDPLRCHRWYDCFVMVCGGHS